MADLTLKVGRVYRGRHVRNCGGLVNDRLIKWMNGDSVQYDSPSVPLGRDYPIVRREKFLAWAVRDVTDELPDNLWADYSSLTKAINGVASGNTCGGR